MKKKIWSLYSYKGFFDAVRNNLKQEININKYLLELIKRRSKVQEKNKSCERALNFDQ